MAVDSGKALKLLAWISPASFFLFLISVFLIGAMPLGGYNVFGIAEWCELIVGTLIAIIAVTFTFARWRSPETSRRGKVLAITGFLLWITFWFLTFAFPHGGG